MANTLITPNDVREYGSLYLQDQFTAPALTNRSINENFGSFVGETVKAKVPAELEASEFSSTTSASDVTESYVDVTLEKHFYVRVDITSTEMLTSLENAMTQVVQPAIRGVLRKVNGYTISRIAGGFARNMSGTAGTDPSTLAHISAAEKKIFDNRGSTDNLVGIINSTAYGSFSQLAANTSMDYQGTAGPAALRANGLNPLMGINFFRDNQAGTFAQGDVAGTVLVKGASQTGSSLIIDGLTASTGTINEGTRITIDGLSNTYTVISDATIASNEATLTLDQALESSPADNAAVTFETAFTENIVYDPMSVAGAFLPGMADRNATILSANGIGIRVVDSEVSTSTLNKSWVFDIFTGVKVVRNQYGTIIQG